MTKLTRAIIGIALLLAASQPLMASTSEDLQTLKESVVTLQKGQEQMQKDLEEIKKLLQQGARAAPSAPQAFKPTDMQLGDVNYKGQQDAPVTLVEFSDYQCPFCKRHATTVMPALLQSYVDNGKLRYVMREYPIENLHRRAVAASKAALCAGDQGDYWGMHDALFNDQRANTDENFQEFAAQLGLDAAAFSDCLGDDRHMAQIKADQTAGQRLGVSGTPSFVLGLTDPDDPGKVKLTKFIRGAQSLPAFEAAIDDLLESANSED